MQLRCFLFKYSVGGEVIRWLHDDGCQWIQQVFVMRLPDGKLNYTGDDGTAVFYKEGFIKLIEEGKVVEL